MISAVLRLRRDNDFNYAKIKDSFIPQDGEICLIDTAKDGLRAVCGDGVTPFAQLKFLDEILQKGYLSNKIFYKDRALTERLDKKRICLYIDLNTQQMYHYDGEEFVEVKIGIPSATASSAGIVKMYHEAGYNDDGTMTQRAITEELDTKVEVSLDLEKELIIFDI